MKPALLFFLAALSACATVPRGAYEQAAPAYVPVGPPPASTPGFYPGTPAEPVYTPNGAGLPGERPFGPGPQTLPRSPNTRALPDEYDAKRESGVWAADGTPGTPVRLFGVEFPYPTDAHGFIARDETEWCAGVITGAASSAKVLDFLLSAAPAERMCLAVRAMEHCGEQRYNNLLRTKAREPKRIKDPFVVDDAKGLWFHAIKLGRIACKDANLTDEQRAALARVFSQMKVLFEDYE